MPTEGAAVNSTNFAYSNVYTYHSHSYVFTPSGVVSSNYLWTLGNPWWFFFVNTLCALLLNLRSDLSTVFSLLIILCNLQILFLIRLPIASTRCFPVSMIMIYKVAIHLGPYFILVVYWLYSSMYWILFHHPSQGLHKYFLIWCLLWGCLYLCSIVLLSLQSLGFCSHTNTHTWLSWSNLVSINLFLLPEIFVKTFVVW